MTREALKKALKGVYDSLTDEQKKKAENCRTAEELIAFAEDEGIEFPDELLDTVAGGIQATTFTDGGPGEFGQPQPQYPQKPKPTWF